MPRLWPVLKRTVAEFKDDNLADRAAALTYYGLLSLFPGLIALVSIVGLVGDPGGRRRRSPKSSRRSDRGQPLRPSPDRSNRSPRTRGTAGTAFILGLAAALWSASGYVGAFIRASNVIYETREGRPFWRLRPLQMAVTLTMVLLGVMLVVGLVLTGPVVDAVAGPLGLGSTAVTVWNVAKWPAMAGVFVLMVGVLYYASPNAKIRDFRWVTPGSLVAIVVWAIASAAFAFYVANFGSYDKTYGTLGGLVALLIWLWISNLAILFGHELNAELERATEIEEGRPGAEQEIQLEPRGDP